ADMSSDILSRPIDVSKFGLIYAGAQKNLGPAGVTVVIIRKSWIDDAKTEGVPKIFRYQTILEGDSLQNTAPTFPIYAVRNNLRWVKEQGGVSAMEAQNKNKAEALYGCISEISNFYTCPVEASSRSLMNAVFRLPTEELEKQFVAEASAQGMHGVKGHRSVGGIRISMYNAIGVDKVHTLVNFMREFAKANS
ncbi:MAG: 3-phosphoserine/phosphohydroxythreonine transaminase, partial [Myxococcota bacterium]